jgi:cytochrome c-type biogenesis protein CcmH/NrfF
VLQSLAALPEPPPDVRRLQLWSHPVTIAVMVTLLGVFWIARKVIGLI